MGSLMGAVPPYIEGREQLRIIGAVSAEVDSAACGEAAELRQVEVDQRLTVGMETYMCGSVSISTTARRASVSTPRLSAISFIVVGGAARSAAALSPE